MSSKSPNLNKSLTESQAVVFIRDVMNMLIELQEISEYNKIYPLFQKLAESHLTLKTHRVAVCNELLKSDIVSLATKFIFRCHEKGYFLNNDIWYTTFYAMNTLWNLSDESQDIVNAILSTDLPNLLISNILHKPYLSNLQSINVCFLMKSSISILHNIVRVCSIEHLPQIDTLKLELVALIKRDNSDFIGIVSMLTLACLVKENELHLLDEGKNTIKILIKSIEIALTDENKRNNGMAIWELLNGLNHISVNDNLKDTIVNENGISTIMTILKTPTSEMDIEKCLGILWNLSFNKRIQATLIDDFNLKTVVKQFENHQSSKIRKNVEGILWLINNENENRNSSLKSSKRSISKEDSKFDLFISYNWDNKKTVMSILGELKKLNLKVWIDVEQMTGSTLEAMANGIESSNMFVLAASEPYRLSPYCRLEVEYAFRIKKPIIPLIVEFKYRPSGWLGLILGNKIYYEFSERKNFMESIDGLKKNIYSILGNKDQKIMKETVVLDTVDHGVIKKSQVVTSSGVETWSNKDVENWLTKNNLGKFQSQFSDVNGKLLASMVDLNSKLPGFLYKTLKNEFGMQLLDILKFKNAIEEFIPK